MAHLGFHRPASESWLERRAVYAHLRTHLPGETIEYTYSIERRDRTLDISYYSSLAVRAGFQVIEVKEQGAGRSFSMALRKP